MLQAHTGTHKIGISSFAYSYACGTRLYKKPEHIMTPIDLIDKAVSVEVEVVQFGDNMPLEIYEDNELENIRKYAEYKGLTLEVGMRKATAERLFDYIDITHKIGGRILRVITDGSDYEPDYRECCRELLSVIPRLEERDVVLGIENHDRFHACEYAEMVKTINHPQVGITVDTVNSLSIEEPIGGVLECLAPYCVCLHLKDYVIKRKKGGGGLIITGACPGTGRLDIIRCYEECNARSPYDFNIILESWMEPCESLEKTIRQEDQWVRDGIAYLKKAMMSDNAHKYREMYCNDHINRYG